MSLDDRLKELAHAVLNGSARICDTTELAQCALALAGRDEKTCAAVDDIVKQAAETKRQAASWERIAKENGDRMLANAERINELLIAAGVRGDGFVTAQARLAEGLVSIRANLNDAEKWRAAVATKDHQLAGARAYDEAKRRVGESDDLFGARMAGWDAAAAHVIARKIAELAGALDMPECSWPELLKHVQDAARAADVAEGTNGVETIPAHHPLVIPPRTAEWATSVDESFTNAECAMAAFIRANRRRA